MSAVRRAAGVLAVVVVLGAAPGCATGSSGPTSANAPVTSTTTTIPPFAREFGPRRELYSAVVPERFRDVAPGSAEAAQLPQYTAALADGSGAVATDPQQGAVTGFTPVIAGMCTRVRSRNADELAVEAREAILPAANGSTTGVRPYEVDRAASFPKVSGVFRVEAAGRSVSVVQVLGLAGPGRACSVSMYTTDVSRDATEFGGVVRSFSIAPA